MYPFWTVCGPVSYPFTCRVFSRSNGYHQGTFLWEVTFSFIFQNKNFSERGAHFEFFFSEFSMFFPELWRERCLITRQKNRVGVFLLFASFKSYDYFSEENACFLKTQSLTVCQKQTRQDIKIFWHCFSEKGVKKARRCWLRPPTRNQPETNLIGEPLYFGK